MDVTITLTTDQVELLIEALDSHEYWQVGCGLPRSEGVVFVPGDFIGTNDPHWTSAPNEADRQAIQSVQSCRRLAQHLCGKVEAAAER